MNTTTKNGRGLRTEESGTVSWGRHAILVSAAAADAIFELWRQDVPWRLLGDHGISHWSTLISRNGDGFGDVSPKTS